MEVTDSLTETQWKVAHQLSIALVEAKTDVNEFSKIISYLRAYSHREDAGGQFFSYVTTLAKNGDRIGHSKQTKTYYQSIENLTDKYLKTYQDDAKVILQILGWTARLMRYYKGFPLGELNALLVEEESTPVIAEKQKEIAKVVAAQKFEEGEILEATVKTIKGNKVTYEILGTIKLTQKEPKNHKILTEGQVVKVSIVTLKEDGGIKKVKLEKHVPC